MPDQSGVLDLLLEPAESLECQALLTAFERTLAGQKHTVLTWLPVNGRKLLRVIFDAEGQLIAASESLPAAQLLEARSHCRNEAVPAPEGLFVEPRPPVPTDELAESTR